MRFRLLAGSALAGAASILVADAALAQTSGSASVVEPKATFTLQDVASADGAASEDVGVITITGSRLSRPNLDSPAPVISVSADDLTRTGNISIGDVLNRLPALRTTFSQSNSTRFIGTAGLNLLDLRGLGTARTLVLVDGRRHVSSQPGVPTSVDVNTIPTDLIERVDVQTGGSSAVYGADAVAGVVNFVLKRDFEGLTARAQGGVSSAKDRGSYFVSLTGGHNFADGRGNFAFNAEYSFANDLYFTDRDRLTGAFSGRNQFNIAENNVGEPASGNGVPDNIFFRGIRNNNISTGGLFTASCPAIPSTGATPALTARRALACTGERNLATNAEIGTTYVFNEAGQLIRNPVLRDLRIFPGTNNAIGGLGATLRETGQLAPQLERLAFNFLTHFEVSEAFRPFLEAKAVRIRAIQEGQPTFGNYTFQLSNPYLGDANRALLTQILAPGATSFTAQRFNTDFGGRGEKHRRDTFRIVAGFDGTFNDDWRYEVAFNYGRFNSFYRTEGNILTARFNNSLNAVRNTTGDIVCGINADANPANDDPSCRPVNLFGRGSVSQEALSYFGVDSTRTQRQNQYNATAFVRGDSSQLFELPGGAVSFALGGEYRRETAYSAFDPVTRSGATFLNAIQIFNPPALETRELFGEVSIPIVKDVPFVQELTVDAAGRMTDYKIGDVGTVYTYNVGGVWAPVRGLRIRATFARSVRAPSQSDLYSPQNQTFLNGLVDPCGQNNINNNPNRVRNCAAAGVPTTDTLPNGTTIPFINLPSSGIRGLSGGNPNLAEERSDSFTLGLVAQPAAIPGLALSIDYYRVKIKNVIFTLGSQTIINQCYDNPSGIDNPFCAAVFRRPDGSFQGQQDRVVGGQIIQYTLSPTDRSFIQGSFNFARQITSGIDFDLSYTRDLGKVRLNTRALVSYVIRRDNFTDINQPNFINQQLLEIGDPKWQGSFNLGLDFGLVDINYDLRVVGKMVPSIGGVFTPIEDFRRVQGRAPENPDRLADPFTPVITYHNLRVGVDATDKFRFYIGVDNVFDQLPPDGILGTGDGEGIYDTFGRFFYAGVQAKFF